MASWRCSGLAALFYARFGHRSPLPDKMMQLHNKMMQAHNKMVRSHNKRSVG
jgi:hypothetical protein